MKADFDRLDNVYDAGKTAVYRGAMDDANNRVVLKVLRENFPSEASREELRHEHRILTQLAELGVEGAIRTHGLTDNDGRLVLATEDLGIDSLTLAINGGKWNRDSTLSVGIAIAEALGDVHDAGFIHKDINPGNVLWDPKTDAIKLLDFGISVRADRDIVRTEALAGTLAYISPEQTGRMNACVDWRSDLYSLGATLYELLTGRMPFTVTSPLELVHAHIAIRPQPPASVDQTIEPLLSDIVMRLLEKNAQDRYQSAFGLQMDLERLRTALPSQYREAQCVHIEQCGGTQYAEPQGRDGGPHHQTGNGIRRSGRQCVL